jgi:hypothetical protein
MSGLSLPWESTAKFEQSLLQERLFTLINYSCTVNTLIDVSGKKLHFQQCSEMGKSLPVALLKRKRGLTKLSEIG